MAGLINEGYSFDTGALIDLWYKYPKDVFGRLWEHIGKLVQEGRLQCPREVLRELAKRDDNLYEWVDARKNLMIESPNGRTWEIAQQVVAKSPGLVDADREDPQADPYVIGHAKKKGWTVVASETSHQRGRPHIPDACVKAGVPCISLIEFFRREGLRL